jgi:hypothetical protein
LGRSSPEFRYTYSSSQTCWSSQRRKGKSINCICIVRCTLSSLVVFLRLSGASCDRFCGLVVRVPGYRSGGPGSIPGTNRKKVVDLEQGPLSLVSTTEELLDRKVVDPV